MTVVANNRNNIGLLLQALLVWFGCCLILDDSSTVEAFSTESSSVASSTTTTKIFEVCLSPGCIADGAQATLEQLQALAPPGIEVKPGVCCSLCGNGPIVMCPTDKTVKKNRRVSGPKLIALLEETSTSDNEGENDDTNNIIPPALLQGYDLSLQAEEAFNKKDYETVLQLYEEVIEIAFRPAMDLQTAREKVQVDNVNENGIPVGLLWLIKARRNEATAKLAMKDIDGAVLAAQAACNLSRNRCSESLDVLASVYQSKGDIEQEYQALTNMFQLPIDESTLSAPMKNRRRELGFRLSSLERQLSS